MASLAWLLEFLLESSGAFFAYRKRLNILAVYLTFSAIADVTTFAVMLTVNRTAYAYAEWITEAVQYLILCALACQIAQKLMAERKGIGIYAATFAGLGGLLCTFVFDRGETWANKFLDSEISASCLLAGAIVLAYVGRKRELEGIWSMVTLGLLCSVSGGALCAIVSEYWPDGMNLYPIPALASLLLWNWSVRPREKFTLPEFRMPLPAKKPPTSVHPASVKSIDLGMRGRSWVN